MADIETPFEKKSCYDCGHLYAAVNWWCGSAEARKARGTAIPGCIHCPFWKPDWSMIPRKFKNKEFGYSSLWDKIKAIIKLIFK